MKEQQNGEWTREFMTESDEKAAVEIVKVLHKNGITYDSIDLIFECAKKLVHSSRITYPSRFFKAL